MSASLEDLIGRQEPYWTYKWAAMIPGFDKLYVESMDLPICRTFSPTSVNRGGRTFNYAGFSEGAGSFTVSFYEDSNLKTLDGLRSWNKEVQDQDTGEYALSSEYKKDMEIDLEDVTGAVQKTIKLQACYPVSVAPYSLQSAQAERQIVQVTFSADYIDEG
jgi:hypothetical protein